MKRSLGTIGALAALCAGSNTSQAAVVISTTVANEVIMPVAFGGAPVTKDLDIDGDGTKDLRFSSTANPGRMVVTQLGNTTYVLSSTTQVKSLMLGDVVGSAQSFSGAADSFLHDPADVAGSIIQNGPVYIGFGFTTGGNYHYGWLEMEVTLGSGATYDLYNDSIVAISAQWEDTPDTAITVVPEPSTTLFAISGLAAAGMIRRRRKH
jgi:hypothetical protein